MKWYTVLLCIILLIPLLIVLIPYFIAVFIKKRIKAKKMPAKARLIEEKIPEEDAAPYLLALVPMLRKQNRHLAHAEVFFEMFFSLSYLLYVYNSLHMSTIRNKMRFLRKRKS